MTNHLVCMIQARLDSTRLPGKILEEIDGLPAIMHTTRRVMESRLHPLVICPQKDRAAIVEALRLPSDTWRVFGWDGPEDDVLGRFVAALDVPPFEVGGVIRITADSSWISPPADPRIATLGAYPDSLTSSSASISSPPAKRAIRPGAKKSFQNWSTS